MILNPLHYTLSSYNAFLKKSLVFSSCLLLGNAFAGTFLPTAPGISLTGLSGNGTTGYLDAMIPFDGQPTNFFYLDPQGLYHSSQEYAASLGFGKRWLSAKTGIWGAYVFGDYNHSPSGNGFWFVSPGVERLGSWIDFSANFYMPVTSTREYTGTYWGNEINNYSYVSFVGHTENDGIFNGYESTSTGGDAEIGFRIPFKKLNPKLYLGAYYFAPKDASHILGGTARLEVPFTNRLSLVISDGYDSFANNTFKAGLTYAFDGRHSSLSFKGDLADRMVDPVRRTLISTSGSAHSAEPLENSYAFTGTVAVQQTNISFFLPGTSGSGDGSYEHPFIGLSQATLDAANAANNRNLYLNMGTYTPSGTLSLNNDSFYGRQSYNGKPFIQQAVGVNRPAITWNTAPGGFTISADSTSNSNTLSSLQLLGNMNLTSGKQIGIFMDNTGFSANNLNINNTDIGNFDGIGMQVNNESTGSINVNFNQVTMNGNRYTNFRGFDYNTGTLNLTINDSSIINSPKGDGIQMSNGWSADQNHLFAGIVNVLATNSHFDGNAGAGMRFVNRSIGTFNVAIKGSTLNSNQDVGLFIENGVYDNAVSYARGTVYVIVDGSHFDNNQYSGGYLQNDLRGTISFIANNSTFNNNGLSGDLSGLKDEGLAGLHVLNDWYVSPYAPPIVPGQAPMQGDGHITVVTTGSQFNGNTRDGITADDYSGYVDTQTPPVTHYGSVIINTTDTEFSNNLNDGIRAQIFNYGIVGVNAQTSTFKANGHDGIEGVNSAGGILQLSAEHSDFIGNQNYGVGGSSSSIFSILNTSTSHFSGNGSNGNGGDVVP